MDKQTEKNDRQTNMRIERLTASQMDSWTNIDPRQIDRQKNIHIDTQTNRQMGIRQQYRQ